MRNATEPIKQEQGQGVEFRRKNVSEGWLFVSKAAANVIPVLGTLVMALLVVLEKPHWEWVLLFTLLCTFAPNREAFHREEQATYVPARMTNTGMHLEWDNRIEWTACQDKLYELNSGWFWVKVTRVEAQKKGDS